MREIKFKAWFPKTKRMTQSFILGQLIEQIENTRQQEEGFYLQFTGLKDKNGVEIYEGDIVKVNGEIYTNHEVRFEEDEAGFCPLLEFSYVKNEFEVIGTIYENPELLR